MRTRVNKQKHKHTSTQAHKHTSGWARFIAHRFVSKRQAASSSEHDLAINALLKHFKLLVPHLAIRPTIHLGHLDHAAFVGCE